MQSNFSVALSGQMSLQKRLETIANNVANASTAGYRAEEVKFETLLSHTSNTPVAFASAGQSYLSRASGEIVADFVVVNRREFEDYFPRETLRMIIAQPFQVTNTVGQFDLLCTVAGGGPTGQAGAVRHGLARALARFDEKLRSPLKKAGLLTRDPRMRERKKYGQPGARQKFQYSKR